MNIRRFKIFKMKMASLRKRVKEFIVETIHEKPSLLSVENYFMKVFEEVFQF